MAVLTARLLKSTILKSKDAPFILEMPPYRWPTLASLGLRLVDRGKAFLYRAGTVIMLVSLLLWAATNFPMHHGQPPQVQNSVVAKLGHAIEPVIRPLGFDWKIGVGLLTSLAAREVIIATLGTLYGIDPESHAADLQAALRHELTPAAAVALLVFFAFAMQCMSTIAVVRRETNGWKWPALQFAYMTVVAYVCCLRRLQHRRTLRALSCTAAAGSRIIVSGVRYGNSPDFAWKSTCGRAITLTATTSTGKYRSVIWGVRSFAAVQAFSRTGSFSIGKSGSCTSCPKCEFGYRPLA